MYGPFAVRTGVTAVSLDTGVSLAWADEVLPERMPIQGNLDPVLLLLGGEAMREGARRILAEVGDRPHIFNLGHGVDKETDPDSVSDLVSIIRDYNS